MPRDDYELKYPILYESADEASRKSQVKYLGIMKLYFLLTILSSLISIYALEYEYGIMIAAIVFLLITGLLILQGWKRYDKIWYNGRAVAESIKTITWRFITRAEPYNDSKNIEEVRDKFCQDIKNIYEQNKGSSIFELKEETEPDVVTSVMYVIRSLNVRQRLDYYIKYRVNEQRAWYFKKAKFNEVRSFWWFIGLVASHILAFILFLIQVKHSEYNIPITPVIVIAGMILSWIQLKKYQDLATSYSQTTRDIEFVKSEGLNVKSEPELSSFVKDAENAFSREHTQWVARKDEL